jgi:menaquinone-dependent protoporphyrinogen oxidase
VNTIFIGNGTTEGQTAKIADVIRGHGHRAQVVNIQASDTSIPSSADGVIIGSSIHMGSHDRHVVRFVQDNLDTLEVVPSAFSSVSLAAHGDTEEAEGYVPRFEEETGRRPGVLSSTHTTDSSNVT